MSASVTEVWAEPRIDVVIPALNATAGIAATLESLAEGRASGLIGRVLVVDGGSGDGTPAAARRAGAEVMSAPGGRGAQLAAGAAAGDAAGDDAGDDAGHDAGDAAVRAPWLLFLHADTRLSPGWAAAALGHTDNRANRKTAAYFRLAFDDGTPRARSVARLANWRARALGLPYGDQGLLISRSFYEALGGFRPLPLMEDVDLARRIGRRRMAPLGATALTSAARYRRGGWWLRPARNLLVLALYLLGVPSARLLRLYG